MSPLTAVPEEEASVPVDHVGVVVPVRDEERSLDGCLSALGAACDHLAAALPEVRVDLVLVLDTCTDASEEVVTRHPLFRSGRVEVLHQASGRVGTARAAGAGVVLSRAAAPERTWLACTDADSQVSRRWLAHHVGVARRGAGLLLGTVDVGARGADSGLARHWRATYQPVDGHPHVHGANLGVRADAYLESGGFADLAAHEDVLLSWAVAARGYEVVRSAAEPVVTSSRRTGRTPDGFATYLRRLAEVEEPVA